MHISSIRCRLLRLSGSQGAARQTGAVQLWQRVFHRNGSSKADPKVLAVRHKLMYCDYLDREAVQLGYVKRRRLQKRQQELDARAKFDKVAYQPVFSVMLDDRVEGKAESDPSKEEEGIGCAADKETQKPVHMPYAMVDSYQMSDSTLEEGLDTENIRIHEKYKKLRDRYLAVKGRRHIDGASDENLDNSADSLENSIAKGELWKVPASWMADYEEFDDTLLDAVHYNTHGTPDPKSAVSAIPCGGCGALLHCKDPAIPGYLPSELFSGKSDDDLKLMICQRCHFLKFYNAALEVKVSAADYPKLLSVIKKRKCAVILMVDLTDFPCCIWPDLRSILHPLTPVYLVGNKVDLLPRDRPSCLENIARQLVDTVVGVTGVNRANIAHVQLTSAKTGYGIEQLINKLQHKWRYKGDVYLVGCTNVGKSSLFNALLNSDYCKVQAADLVRRATVSAWPGTTLNLLKFPLTNPTPKKLALRTERLISEAFYRREEAKYRDYLFQETRNIQLATLEDHVGRTHTGNSLEDERVDPFMEKSAAFMVNRPALDESRPEYEQSRWCYDTPGTIQPDQILDLLTTDELLLTVPQRIISPRTFIFKPGQTVFLAGLGRLDYLEGEYFVRCTLFASNDLPITICHTVDADQLYEELLVSDAFAVPVNDPERLKVWPKLESKDVKVTGVKARSAADVVLSSAGWIAIAAQENETALLRGWTPRGRGIHLRCPALLENSVNLHGPKVHGTPMYMPGRQVFVRRA